MNPPWHGVRQFLAAVGVNVSYSISEREADFRLATARLVRLNTMRAEIGGRLWRVTQGMRVDTFDALVNRMAVVQDKYEQRRLLDRW